MMWMVSAARTRGRSSDRVSLGRVERADGHRRVEIDKPGEIPAGRRPRELGRVVDPVVTGFEMIRAGVYRCGDAVRAGSERQIEMEHDVQPLAADHVNGSSEQTR